MSDASESGTGPYSNVYYLTQVTKTNHAAWLWIAGLLTLLYPMFSAFVRLNVRAPRFGIDDHVLVGSTFISVAQHIALFVALAKGLGKTSNAIELMGHESQVDRAILAARILFIFTQTGAKASLALFVRRLFDNSARINTLLCNGLVAATLFWGVSAIVIPQADCPFTLFANAAAQCPSEATRWWFVTALDIATEILLFAVPTILVSKVMITGRAKILVCAAFACRFPLIVFTTIHAIAVARTNAAADRAFSYVSVIVWIQILLAWSLISASIPSFKAFMHPFDAVSDEGTYGGATRSQVNGSYLMMGKQKPKGSSQLRSGRSDKSAASADMRMRPDVEGNKAVISAAHRRSVAEDEHDSLHSQADIIRRDVQWNVSYDNAKNI